MNWLDMVKEVFSSMFGGGLGASVSVPLPPSATFSPALAVRPPMVQHPSPNFRRTPGRQVLCVVLHATAGGAVGAMRELCDPKPQDPTKRVSAHYLIDKSGLVYQMVHEEDVAWHAGVSYWLGRANVNDFSVGIEFENRNDGVDEYPEPQIASGAQLVRAICQERGIAPENVIGHADIAPGRKTDPGPAFPWVELRRRLIA